MDRAPSSFLIAAGLSLAFIASTALAQAPATAPPPAPDIVRLRGGGLLRGTIAENIPEQHVVIVTIAGTARTIPAADVLYAGPVVGDPLASAAPAPTSSGTAVTPAEPPTPSDASPSEPAAPTEEVTLAGDGLAFFVREGAVLAEIDTADSGTMSVTGSNYRQLCVAPCSTTLVPGTYQFALAESGGRTIAAGDATVGHGSRVTGEYQNNLSIRILGWVLAGGSLIAGAGYALGAEHSPGDTTPLLIGLSIGGVGALIGLVMALVVKDSASVVVE